MFKNFLKFIEWFVLSSVLFLLVMLLVMSTANPICVLIGLVISIWVSVLLYKEIFKEHIKNREEVLLKKEEIKLKKEEIKKKRRNFNLNTSILVKVECIPENVIIKDMQYTKYIYYFYRLTNINDKKLKKELINKEAYKEDVIDSGLYICPTTFNETEIHETGVRTYGYPGIFMYHIKSYDYDKYIRTDRDIVYLWDGMKKCDVDFLLEWSQVLRNA